MNWDALGSLSELVGAVAVVLTLLYLTTQIRQGTNQMRNEGHIGVTNSYNAILKQLFEDDDLFKIVVQHQ